MSMVGSKMGTVAEYLESLPPERRANLSAVRKVLKKNLPRGVEENMAWGMICYSIPLSKYPQTYNGQPFAVAGLAAQKNHDAVYLMGVYADPALAKWFREEYAKTGKKMDIGQSCVRFKKLEDLPLELVGEAVGKNSVEEIIARAESARSTRVKLTRAEITKRTAAKKAAVKKAAVKKAAVKKRVSRPKKKKA